MEFFRKKDPRAAKWDDLQKQLRDCEQKKLLLFDFAGSLIILVKELSVEAEDLDTPSIKERLDGLSEKLRLDSDVRSLETGLERDREELFLFAGRQQEYLKDREAELAEIIETLTGAIASIGRENRVFTERIQAQSDRIEKLTRLNDLKQLKDGLSMEVEQVRRTVFEKQFADEQRIERLSRRVHGLDTELKHMKMTAFRDGLTGTYNLQALERRMEEAVTKSSVTGVPLSFLVLDIDHYPEIIKTSGQNLADRVILAIAQNCQSFISTEEFLARCREGIFSIVIPGQQVKYAAKRARRLCRAIASARYMLEESQPRDIISFTVSIGLSGYGRGDDSRSIVERGLRALYAAKRAGGNRVVTEKSLFLRFKQGGENIDPLY